MKKSLLLTSLVLGTFLLMMVGSVSAATIFSDGFESNDFSQWNQADDDWDTSNYDPHAGTYASFVTGQDGSADILRRDISTAGYNNIVFSYWYKIAYSIGSGEHVYAQWYDGSNWNNVADYTNVGEGVWTHASFSLPSGAINNPSFKIRFKAEGLDWSQCDTDLFKLDDVVISGDAIQQPTCKVIVDEPSEGEYYDPVTVRWHYEGNCDPIEYNLFYQVGTCDGDNWIGPFYEAGASITQYEWDVSLMPSGSYCIAVNMDQEGANDVTGHSGLWYLDLASPEVSLSVGTPKYEVQPGDCSEETSGSCYVNKNTPITLTCADNVPPGSWQSGVDYIEYRYSVDGGQSWIKDWTTIANGGQFTFQEDSNHLLEYRCFDKVEKVDSEEKNFFVETVAPTLTRTVSGPQECPEGEEGCDEYFNLETQMCLTASDPDPHPSNNVQIVCDWWYGDVQGQLTGHHGSFSIASEGCFSYIEDSYHTLVCTATDALGNHVEETWMDVVDAKAPVTTLSYTGPQYPLENPKWIDTDSRVVLSTTDSQPHPVGGVTTFYRYGVLPDNYCDQGGEYSEGQVDWETQGWVDYQDTPFGLPESCHVIEYYSVDALGNSEAVKVEFVFSDHTAPELDLIVGESGKSCLNPLVGCEQGWDWKVTMDTPITISCDDQEPHPSGVGQICYTIYWDGSEVEPTTECGKIGQSSVTFEFTESCVHRVEYTCTDNVGKQSSDSAVFKVIGEDFEIELNKKWNLISVPVNLLSSDVQEVFGNDPKIEEVWSYEDEVWLVFYPDDVLGSTLETIVPGRGYWVKTSDSTDLVVGGSLFEEATVPNSVPLYSGWNLIGHYGVVNKPAYCSLFSLVDTQQGFPRWSALIGYNSASKQFYGLNSAATMQAGKGYWVEMDVEDSYNYATQCWGYNPVY